MEITRKIKPIYRVHFTCPAGHTSYADYRTKKHAQLFFARTQDPTGWYATLIEIVYPCPSGWEKIDA